MSSQVNNMRTFHNNVKMFLLRKYVFKCNCKYLLDIGSGRGGDIFKYDRCNINTVIGLDIDNDYINEAYSRMSKSKFKGYRNYLFLLINQNETSIFHKLHSFYNIKYYYKIISCQFALHYFFQNTSKLQNLCLDINNLLDYNGFFIGTVLDGDKVRDCFLHNKSSTYSNKSIVIDSLFDLSQPKSIGDCINFYMYGTLYFGEKSVSTEYLVYKDILVDHLKKYNIELVEWVSFQELFIPEIVFSNRTVLMDNTNLFYSFFDDDTKTSSFLYSTFVFKKIST